MLDYMFELYYHVRGDITPWTTLSFVFCSLILESEPFIIICSPSDYSCSRLRPKTQYMIWTFNPTIAPQNSGFFLSSEKKAGVLNFQELIPLDLLIYMCGSAILSSPQLPLMIRSPRGAINCSRRHSVPQI